MAATGNEAVILRQLKSFKDWVGNQLAGKAASSHNHAASNITSGTLTVARGGTGVTTNPSMLVNLASTSADTVFEATPRPGVTGTLPINRGGTGATSAAAARSALGAAANTTATTSAAGLMSASDKAKLDSMDLLYGAVFPASTIQLTFKDNSIVESNLPSIYGYSTQKDTYYFGRLLPIFGTTFSTAKKISDLKTVVFTNTFYSVMIRYCSAIIIKQTYTDQIALLTLKKTSGSYPATFEMCFANTSTLVTTSQEHNIMFI